MPGFDPVEFTGWEVITQKVAAVVRGVERAVPWRPVEADTVAQSCGDDRAVLSFGGEAHERGAPCIVFDADIAGRTLREIQRAIGADAHRLAPVIAVIGKA